MEVTSKRIIRRSHKCGARDDSIEKCDDILKVKVLSLIIREDRERRKNNIEMPRLCVSNGVC